MAKINKYSKIILLIILGLACLLRFWSLDKVPVSLYADELDVGYQAYSLLGTGKDYFGNAWPLHFQSYADIRTPLYIYSSLPSVWLFGITAWGVRFPAAIFGALAVWGIYLLSKEISGSRMTGLVGALLLAISPWHIQYSRVAFEVTMLLAFLLFGLYFFFKALKSPKHLWISVTLLAFTLWIYNTAVLFTPLIMVFLFLVWKKQILSINRPERIKAIVAGLVVGLPIIYGLVFGGGSMRAGYLSVFTDPITKSEVDYSILSDAKVRNSYGGGVISKIFTRVVHNKYTFWSTKVINNYVSALSSDFLFLKGDPNLRHTISGIGQFYKFEIIPLLIGIVFFFTKFKNKKIKSLILFWIFAGILPAAITRDGGNHATRLILILPPLIFLVAYGLLEALQRFKGPKKMFIATGFALLYLIGFLFYQHNYWMHNVWDSERSWQAGYKEVVEVATKSETQFKRIIITNANDDPRIFFAAYYPANPTDWQKGLKVENISGFGELPYFGKFHFGQVDGKVGLSRLGSYLDFNTLYIASAREIKWNLIMEPQKTPEGLRLVKSISYPSGEPAFYVLAKEEN